MGALLAACGVTLVVLAGWRSYAVARGALGPVAHAGDPTRRSIEGRRPLPLRPTVRRMAWQVAVSVGWLVLAMYGLYLLARGQALLGLS